MCYSDRQRVCVSRENDCGQLAGPLSDTLRTLSLGGRQCEGYIRPSHSTERPERSGIVGSQLYNT